VILALDFGGTKLRAAAVGVGQREWLARRQALAPADVDARVDMRTMLRLSRKVLAGKEGSLRAVGVSFGGPVDAIRGVVLRSYHVPGWEDTPLRDRLCDAFEVPVAVDNDANVAAAGEWRFGAGQGCDSLLFVTVSTGIGGGWVLGGRVHRGADGMAGEIGHIVLRSDGPACACGKRGCLEALASGPAIARHARELVTADPDAGAALRASAGGDPERITATHVGQAARDGDPLAQRVLGEAAHALGLGLGTAITLMNPQRVILGGGVTQSGGGYLEDVREAARSCVLPEMTVDIVPGVLGDDAALWGAVVLAEGLLSDEA
jgi:glucokinase